MDKAQEEQIKIMKYFAIVLLLLVIVTSVFASPNIDIPTEKADKNFTIYYQEDSKDTPLFADRNFGELTIFSSATTYEQRVHTSLFAAKQFLEKEDLSYVRVFHLAYGHKDLVGNGSFIARADYAPDGKGDNTNSSFRHKTWQASAVKGTVDELDVLIEIMWYQMRDDYQKVDNYGSYTDEPALRKAISDMVDGKLLPSEIHLPSYELINY